MVKMTAEETYKSLKAMILAGSLRPAERLIETALADSLHTSRHKVRTALDRLQSDGLVEIEANKGARVRSLALGEVLDLYTAREGLEAELVRLAVERINETELEKLRNCLDAMQAAFAEKRFDEYSSLNRQFHGIIHAASGNQTLPELIRQIQVRLARLNLRVILLPGRGDSTLEEHGAIYTALESGDAALADQAIRRHIANVRGDIERGWEIVRI